MNARGLRWLHDPGPMREQIESALADRGDSECIAESRGRLLLRPPGCDAGGPLIKLFRLRSGPHPWREGLKTRLGVSAPQREWRALRAMKAKNVPAPTPLGRAGLVGGDALIVCDFIEGPTLHALLQADPTSGREELGALADAVRTLHASGWAHGDLHLGNAIASPQGVVLIDWQRARRSDAGGRRQIDDLGRLDHSLATLEVPVDTRASVLERALPSDCPARERERTLGAVHAASRRIARRHARRRAREAASGGAQPSSGNSRHSPSPTRS